MLWPSEVLPTPGGPDEAQDRAAALRVELAHREVLEDALLDLLEAVVVGVEDAARALDVDRLRVELRPRQRDQPVEVGARHRVLAARLGHALEALQLLARVLLDLRRHAGLGDRLGQLRRIFALAVLAELLLDLLHLLAQHELALAVVDRLLGLLLDLARQLQHLDAVREVAPTRARAGRARRSISRSSCFSAGLMSMKLAIMSASADGDSIACTLFASSAGACGSSSIASTAFCFRYSVARARPPGGSRRCRSGIRRAPRGTGSRPPGRARGSAARPGRPGGGCRRAR